MNLTDKYKLNFVYSTDGNSFLLTVPFIPIADIYVPASKLAPLHNGRFIQAQDLKSLLSYKKRSIAITVSNLMHFDLSNFVLSAGTYCPNHGEFLLQNTLAAENGKPYVLPADSVDCDPSFNGERTIKPTVFVKDFYALLYLQEN